MPVTDRALAQQSRRLLKLPFAPSTEEDVRGLLDEFKRVLRPRVLTEAHCSAVIDHLMEHAMRCPPPAEVLQAAESVEAPDVAKAPMGCTVCTGSGFRHFSKRVHTPAGDYEADFSDFCRCALGEFKRAGEARQLAKEAEKARRG